MSLTLIAAFERLGAKPGSRTRGVSAIAADGALVLNCSHSLFGHPVRGVLRYEDKLSRESNTTTRETAALTEHLALARDGALPVRMLITTSLTDAKSGRSSRSFHVRPDLIGKIVKFDGDHFIVDFTRSEEAQAAATSTVRKPRQRLR
jgi:hypothetical protein